MTTPSRDDLKALPTEELLAVRTELRKELAARRARDRLAVLRSGEDAALETLMANKRKIEREISKAKQDHRKARYIETRYGSEE